MMRDQPNKNPAASIRARLLSLSQEKGEDYQRVLGRFAIERFLYRLGTSLYRDRFVLKGATLFTLWTGETHRPTKDLDLLGWGSSAIADVEQVSWQPFRSILSQLPMHSLLSRPKPIVSLRQNPTSTPFIASCTGL